LLRAIRDHAHADRSIAAGMLAILLSRDEGIPTTELMSLAGAASDPFGDALALLLFLDLIGIAKDGSRVWLLTQARQILNRA